MDEVTQAPYAPPAPNGAPPKTRAIDRLRSAYYASRDKAEVPEWASADGTPFEIFFSPITAADMNAVDARTTVLDPMTGIRRSTGTPQDRNLTMFIHKAQDDQGTPLFALGDKQVLETEVDYAVIVRLVTEMNQCGALKGLQTLDEAKAILGADNALYFRMQLADYLKRSLDEIEAMPLTHLTLWAAFLTVKAERERLNTP